ncbi:unnamed protein product [Discosporangium mesarthrocarpum]
MVNPFDPYALALSLLVGLVGFGMTFFFNTSIEEWTIKEIGYPLAGMVYVYIRNARFFPEEEVSTHTDRGEVGAGKRRGAEKVEAKIKAAALDGLGTRLVAGKPLSPPGEGELKVVFFWATWCSNSNKVLPALLATAARYREEGASGDGLSLVPRAQ